MSESNQHRAVHDLLRERNFALLWAGQLLSQIGDQCLLIASITLITNLSASPLAILIPAISVALPQVFFGMMGGVVADRWDRKRVMVVAEADTFVWNGMNMVMNGSGHRSWLASR